jgi:hypothetical protein
MLLITHICSAPSQHDHLLYSKTESLTAIL